MEECCAALASGNKRIRLIDSDLSACIDAVLSLPEFDQLGTALIIEVNRLAVEDHACQRRTIVVEPAIAKVPLPGIVQGSEDILGQEIFEPEGADQFI